MYDNKKRYTFTDDDDDTRGFFTVLGMPCNIHSIWKYVLKRTHSQQT